MISVIIPTYNRANVIKRTLVNVLSQTYTNIEIIIIDDNSNDNTKEVIASLNDKRIKYYRNEKNKGACFSRNYGIRISKGDYIAFQDSDDLWSINKLKKQLDFLQERGADIVFCKVEKYNENNELIGIVPNSENDGERVDFSKLLRESIISTQTIMGRSACFERIKFDDQLPRFQDWDLVLRLSKEYKIIFQNEVLAYQYIQQDSITKNYKKAVSALEELYQRYFSQTLDKEALGYYWDLKAMCQYQTYDKGVFISYIRAFMNKKTMKSLIKVLLCKSNYLNNYLVIKRKTKGK